MRRKFVWDPKEGRLVEVPTTWTQAPRGPLIVPDLPGYQSPVTGLWVEGRKQRREDLKRTNSRPWEGREQEQKEAARQRAYADQAHDRRIEEAVRKTYHQLPPEKRRILERG